MVTRPVSGAHYGLRDWLAQRITAILMTVYVVIIAIFVLRNSPISFQEWQDFVRHPWLRFLSFLFFLSMALHAWIGMRDVLMDYVRPTPTRLTLQVLVILLLMFYTLWAAQILWR